MTSGSDFRDVFFSYLTRDRWNFESLGEDRYSLIETRSGGSRRSFMQISTAGGGFPIQISIEDSGMEPFVARHAEELHAYLSRLVNLDAFKYLSG